MSKHETTNTLDKASREMLYEGCNLSQLSLIFGVDHRTLVRRMHGLRPAGMRRGYEIYHIRDVAPRMWRPTEEEVEKALMTMNHADLPKMLTKEFWAAKRSRQEFELKAGDLWPTERVIESVGSLLKLVKMQVQLMTDAVERSSELTEQQRKVVKSLTNGMLADLQKEVVKHFTPKGRNNGAAEDEDDDEL